MLSLTSGGRASNGDSKDGEDAALARRDFSSVGGKLVGVDS
jgi:hypothetical protein